MLRLLRKLIGAETAGEEADTAAKPVSATSDILAKGKDARRSADGQPRSGREVPPADAFDPYNTGAFDRSASWERIRKRNL